MDQTLCPDIERSVQLGWIGIALMPLLRRLATFPRRPSLPMAPMQSPPPYLARANTVDSEGGIGNQQHSAVAPMPITPANASSVWPTALLFPALPFLIPLPCPALPVPLSPAPLPSGASCQRQGKYREAIGFHKIVLETSAARGTQSGVTEAYGAIADCYTELGDLEEAAKYYDKYISLLENSETD